MQDAKINIQTTTTPGPNGQPKTTAEASQSGTGNGGS